MKDIKPLHIGSLSNKRQIADSCGRKGKMDINNLIPLAAYAEMIGRNPVSVRQKCQRGNVPGAVKLGRDWFILADAPYPDQRVKSGRYRDWRKPKTQNSGEDG